MINKTEHPERTALLKSARSGGKEFHAHMSKCSSCRQIYILFTNIGDTSDMEFEEPSSEAIARFCQIPIIQQNVKMLSKYNGIIAADSWQGATPIDLRDVTTGFVRHLKLISGKTSLELVAERKENSWSFVARVYEGKKISSEYLLWIGAKRLLSRSQGFYIWSSKRPPGKIRLISHNKEIEFEQLQWA